MRKVGEMEVIQIDMPMPDSCSECRFETARGFCKAMPDNSCGFTNYEGRPEWCPLKEQEAVEPIAIKKEMFDEFYGAVSYCPKCDCLWIMYMENDMHYCPECGQAVKWE